MRIIGLIFLFALALADEKHYFHQSGKMSINHEEGTTSGVIIVEFLKAINMTHVAGMYIKDGTKTPFDVSSKVTGTAVNTDGSFEINMTCFVGSFGKKMVKKLAGNAVLKGTWEKAQYVGSYRSEVDHLLFEFDTVGTKSPCEYYSMDEAARRASDLLDQSYAAYKPNHLLNHAVYGYAYLSTTCLDYLRDVGTPIERGKPGALIVSNDGTHCAIVDHEGHKFIHSSPSKRRIIMTPMSLVPYYFRKGYTMKEYKCANN